MERLLRGEKEIDPKDQSFVIEFAGTPLSQRGEKLVQPYGDYLRHVFGFDVRYNAIDPTGQKQFTTTEDILSLARSTVDRVVESSKEGKFVGVLIPGGILEELAYIEFYRRTGVLKENEAEPYKEMLMQYRERIGLAIVVLMSPRTSLSVDGLASLHFDKPDFYGLHRLSSKPRRILKEESLDELNDCFVNTIRDYGDGFNKIHTIDLRKINLHYRNQRFGRQLAKGVWTGLARVYPLPDSFPLAQYKPIKNTF